jgi:hypothetical protein
MHPLPARFAAGPANQIVPFLKLALPRPLNWANWLSAKRMGIEIHQALTSRISILHLPAHFYEPVHFGS